MAAQPTFSRPIHPWVSANRDRIRFGVAMLIRSDWSAYLAWAQEAEALGFDSLWAQDHPPRYPDWGTTLAAVAMATTTIRLGPMVSCIYYRSPVVLAQVAADVDRISGGRFVLGVGIGDFPPEFAQLGITVPLMRARQEALVETIQIVNGLWGTMPYTLEGAHFHVHAVNVQRPVQQPHVPLLIAGGGERVTLRRVAEYADMSNFGPSHLSGNAHTLEDVQRKLAALRGHCAAVGRAYESVLPSHHVLPLVIAETPGQVRAKVNTLAPAVLEIVRPSLVAGTPREVAAYYRTLIAAGMRYFIPTLLDNDFESLRLLAGAVIPELEAT